MNKENETIEDRITEDIRKKFEHEEEDYYIPVQVYNVWSNSYIEYESNNDRNKNLLTKEYVYKIRSYVKCIIDDIKNSDTWKIQ